MATDSPNSRTKGDTPFRKFEQLARKLVGVPKDEATKPKKKRKRS